jgi:L-alanine-DL-glutamate epimerase-like enolase superfamily enzyme
VRYLGQSSTTVVDDVGRMAQALKRLPPLPATPDSARSWLQAAWRLAGSVSPSSAAQCAIDIALHDIVGRHLGLPLHALLGVTGRVPPTDYSLGIDRPELVARRAVAARRFPALKIKVGGPYDLGSLRAVRAAYDGQLRLDANGGWLRADAAALIAEATGLGVGLIEQPFGAGDLASMAWLSERSPIPVVADESFRSLADLERLSGVVHGVNVKLAKCGGLTPALAILERARELGLRVMLGCMEETSIAIRAAVALAPRAEWIDLDGCLLLSNDPIVGLELDGECRWRQPSGPGLGLACQDVGKPALPQLEGEPHGAEARVMHRFDRVELRSGRAEPRDDH